MKIILGLLSLISIVGLNIDCAKPVSQKTRRANVKVRFVNEAAACYVVKGKVTLKTQGRTYTARTARNGFANFKNVLCDDVAGITSFDSTTSNRSGEPAIIKIPCRRNVNLGAFDSYSGDRVTEGRANYCNKLNPSHRAKKLIHQ